MESDDSDSDNETDHFILLQESFEAITAEKQELTLSILYQSKVVGYLSAVIMDVGCLKSGGFKDEKLKCRDKEVEDEILLFYKSVSKFLSTHVIFYITDFFLEKEYRGSGIGGEVLDLLPQWLKIHHPEVNDLYLFPYPLEKNNGKVECVKNINAKQLLEMREKLIRFYTHHGLQKTTTEFLYMPLAPVA